jgi:hypothetical protein
MLPATPQFLIVMIATAINDRLQRKLDYRREEVSVLKEQLAALTGEPPFTARHRREPRRRMDAADGPNCSPHAECFVKTIRYECLNHLVFFGERHLRSSWGSSWPTTMPSGSIRGWAGS